MRDVLLVQGAGEGAHRVDAKLAASLRRELGPGYDVHFPAMPNENDPQYAAWKDAIAKHIETLGDGPILVGHSVGGAILASFLSETKPVRDIAGIFLVSAPFVGRGGWHFDEYELPNDLGAHLSKGAPVFLYQGRDDKTVPFAHLHLYARAIPQATVRALDGRDHQLNDDMSEVAADIRAFG